MPIHVAVRARPLFPTEKRSCELVSEGRQIGLVYNEAKLLFGIPQLFSEAVTNGEVADSILPPVIDKAIGGCISAVIAYGQTNSGKTYTILGDEHLFLGDTRRKRGSSAKKGSSIEFRNDWDPTKVSQSNKEGLILQGLRRIYNLGFMVKLSFLEVYCERLYDLQTSNTPYSVMIDHSSNPDRNFYYTSSFSSLLAQLNTGSMPQLQQTTGTFKNLTETVCDTFQQAFSCLKNACKQRMTASTIRNDVSSRSHFLAITTVLCKPPDLAGGYSPLGKIYFCDLAGSERFNAFEAVGSSVIHSPGRKAREERRLAEGIDINKSLLTLRKVLEDLASRKNHVPYRASTLTKILRTPFENGYVIFLATVNASNTTETKRTLDYACITRRITFTKAQSVISKTHQNMNCICQDCLKKIFRSSVGAERYPSILFCKFCGNEIGTFSDTDESFCHKRESDSVSECASVPDGVESLRVKGTPRHTLKKITERARAQYNLVSSPAARNLNKNILVSNHLDQEGYRQSATGGRATGSSGDKFESCWTSSKVESNTSDGVRARPISAIDIVTQEIQSVNPSAQLISVASLLYGLDSQIEDQVRESSAAEDHGTNVVEMSMQTDSQRNDASDEQLEKEDRDDSPSIWSIYESSLRKTQIHLPLGVAKGMQLHKSFPDMSPREHTKPLSKESSNNVLDMLEEANILLRKSSLNLSTMDRKNKKTNTTYLIAVVCNEILETKGFELNTLAHSTLCLDTFYTILARIICLGNPKYKSIQVEDSTDYKVLVYKLKKESTLTSYNYEQLRMDAFSEAYCQVDTCFEMFMSTLRKAEQENISEETIKEVILMASEALISNLVRIVSSAVYECFAALLEEVDGQLSLSALSQRSKMSSDLQGEFETATFDSTSTTNIVSSFLAQIK